VIERARSRLRELEDSAQRHTQRESTQLPLFPLEMPNPAVDALRGTDPDGMTPREALELVYRLKKLADETDNEKAT
jgi:DNA mismatch repair protein MutS